MTSDRDKSCILVDPDTIEKLVAEARPVDYENRLQEISRVLGVPAQNLRDAAFGQAGTETPRDDIATDAECATLLAAYRRIGNPLLRQRYLALLQVIAATHAR